MPQVLERSRRYKRGSGKRGGGDRGVRRLEALPLGGGPSSSTCTACRGPNTLNERTLAIRPSKGAEPPRGGLSELDARAGSKRMHVDPSTTPSAAGTSGTALAGMHPTAPSSTQARTRPLCPTAAQPLRRNRARRRESGEVLQQAGLHKARRNQRGSMPSLTRANGRRFLFNTPWLRLNTAFRGQPRGNRRREALAHASVLCGVLRRSRRRFGLRIHRGSAGVRAVAQELRSAIRVGGVSDYGHLEPARWPSCASKACGSDLTVPAPPSGCEFGVCGPSTTGQLIPSRQLGQPRHSRGVPTR